jgi:hypothetical protein
MTLTQFYPKLYNSILSQTIFLGVNKNVLLDKDGTFFDNGKLKELLELGSKASKELRVSKLDTKEHRVSWLNKEHHNRKFTHKKKI